MKTVASSNNVEIVEKTSPSKNSSDGFFHCSDSSESIKKAFEAKEKKAIEPKCAPCLPCVIL